MLRRSSRKVVVGVLGFIAGSLVVGVLFGSASATTPPAPPVFSVTGTVTANQGTPGTKPWPVFGTIGLSNFPLGFNVNNFPSTQPVSGTVGVNNFPSNQQVSGTVGVNNFPSNQQVSGTVTANQGTNPWVVTEAEPGALFDSASVKFTEPLIQVAEPPTSQALIIESIHVSAICLPTVACEVDIHVGQPSGASSCPNADQVVDNVLIQPSETLSGSPPQLVPQPSQTLYVLPYSPGLLIPNGCALNAIGASIAGGYVSATGYEVPASDE